VPQIEVTFDIDANGILNVAAQDKATGKQQNITITASSGLTKDEIERMVKDAQAHAAEDATRKQEIEVRNQTDSLVYSTERTLGEHGAKLPEADRKAVEEALAAAREALKSEDVERMKGAQETLTRASHKLAEIMYREAQARDLFGEIEEAYRVLSDPAARAMYDRFGHALRDGEALAAGRRGEDVHVAVQLAFADVVQGTSLRLEVARFSSCTACGGSG